MSEDRLAEIEGYLDYNWAYSMIPKSHVQWLIEEVKRLRDVLDEVKSCGHSNDCSANFSEAYRCRCHYGIIAEADQRTSGSELRQRPTD